jgi:hypothetical protein
VPDAFVIVEPTAAPAPAAAAPAPAAARAVLADCALSPRAVVGAPLVLVSAVDRPAHVIWAQRGTLAQLADLTAAPARAAGPAGASGARTVRLPIAGHAVQLPVALGAVYQLSTADSSPEVTWLVSPPSGAVAAITDEDGRVALRGLAAGRHTVTAWLPPRAGHAGRLARGSATVVDGAVVDLALDLAGAPRGPAPVAPAAGRPGGRGGGPGAGPDGR